MNKPNIYYTLLLLVCLLINHNLHAQQFQLKEKVSFNWENKGVKADFRSTNRNVELNLFERAAQSYASLSIKNISWNAIDFSIKSIQWENDKIPLEFELEQYVEAYVAIARKVKSGHVELPISFDINNQVYRIASINLDVNGYTNNERNTAVKQRRASSVLASGNWYKFGIPESGVYKLSYAFLKELGIDVDNTSIASYSIFGQQGGMLPMLAGAERTDDLVEIPIAVSSSGNVLREGDFLIFYGEGPNLWSFDDNSERFVHSKHLYSDYKGYFISTNTVTGKRVQVLNQPNGNADRTYNTYDAHQFYENNEVNINKSGRDWLGDEFVTSITKNYNFDFGSFAGNSNVRLDYRVAARSALPSSFTIDVAGNSFNTASLAPVNLTNYLDTQARAVTSSRTVQSSDPNVRVSVQYNLPVASSKGWLDYLAVNARAELRYNNKQLPFRVADSKRVSIASYNIANYSSAVNVWDVSDLFKVSSINANNGSFKSQSDGEIKQFIAFRNADLLDDAVNLGSVANQDLHGLGYADYIVIARPSTLTFANELAQLHANEQGLSSHVVTYEQIINEFASGNNDMVAIRDFLKMFYDRTDYPKYVLLFGDGSFDNRNLGEYLIPTFQNSETFATLNTFVSDDFLVFLDDNEGNDNNGSSNRLDMAIGRIPADDFSKANTALQKIRQYYSNDAFGSWRNVGTYVADDEDNNLHFRDAETNSTPYMEDNPVMNIDKIYLDAYEQVAGSGGGSYPEVNAAINANMFKGNLFLNYIGHGGTNGLAEEGVITLNDITSWDNPNKLPLIISATCEFTRYDDIEIYSAGERAFFRNDGGAIALVTTVRVVFASQNRSMNTSFMNAMTAAATDKTMTLGDIIMQSKNNSVEQRYGNRKFALIGDPALRLAFPEFHVQTNTVNAYNYQYINDTNIIADTLKALTKVTITGEVQNNSYQRLNDFNGFVYPTVYDKFKTITTLGNDDKSFPADFEVQNNIIYAGKVQANNGEFSFTFVVPKDINYTFGNGKISYYAHNDSYDAAGNDTIVVGGGGRLDSNSLDQAGPEVEVFIDDEAWISGDLTDENPDLLVHLFDENGINTVGSGIGHDIEAVLDDNTQNAINLNDFYESDLNSYQSGKVLYPFELIPPGTHTVTVKAWDVYNNSGEGLTEFVVAEAADLALEHVLNYPNPFTTNTNFMFQHNRIGDVLDVRIEIFTVSGKLVKTLQETAVSDARNVSIPWDGLDQYGDRIGKGVYIYKVTLKDSSGEKAEEFQKLVLLR